MFNHIVETVKEIFTKKSERLVKEAKVIDRAEHRIDPEWISWEARRTCELLQQRGFEAYIVGGAVRDLLLGVKPKDFDVVTNATPEQVKRAQRRAIIIGRRFRLVHVIFGREIIECSTFRALDAEGQKKDESGRVVSDNVFGEMWEDAARRDFTINALYYDPQTEKLYDYHEGYRDIEQQRLRMIGEPSERYREDPVRMMRAIRIASKLGFKIERKTEEPIRRMAGLLENIPPSRLFDETLKLLTCGQALVAMHSLREKGLHHALLPLVDIICSEPDGERFLRFALERTDARIAEGKKISPSFLFTTLLWPQISHVWEKYEQKGSPRAMALHCAALDLIDQQCEKLAIQKRFSVDIHDLCMLQLRFERCTGKNPYTLVEHPRYRAGFDFLLLRSLLGYVPTQLVEWWEEFALADEDRRQELVEEAQKTARLTGDKARAKRKTKRVKSATPLQEGARKPRHHSKKRTKKES